MAAKFTFMFMYNFILEDNQKPSQYDRIKYEIITEPQSITGPIFQIKKNEQASS